MASDEWRERQSQPAISSLGAASLACARQILRRGLDVLVGDEDLFARLVPAAVLVDAAEGADGADDAVGGGSAGFGLLDDVTEGVLCSGGAAFEEADGVRVSVDDEAIAELKVISEVGSTPPMKEGFVDGVTFRVVADGAMGFVAIEVYLLRGSPFSRF